MDRGDRFEESVLGESMVGMLMNETRVTEFTIPLMTIWQELFGSGEVVFAKRICSGGLFCFCCSSHFTRFCYLFLVYGLLQRHSWLVNRVLSQPSDSAWLADCFFTLKVCCTSRICRRKDVRVIQWLCSYMSCKILQVVVRREPMESCILHFASIYLGSWLLAWWLTELH